jgi:ubiquinone/menaquinone biosynthesis C-methylase UbiE
MEMKDRSYIPALGFDWLTRFYDPLLALTLGEKALKGRLLDQARIASSHDVLDVGCGTGTLAILAKTRQPRARVVGLDGDPAVLAIARASTWSSAKASRMRSPPSLPSPSIGS